MDNNVAIAQTEVAHKDKVVFKAASVKDGFRLNEMNIRDADSGRMLWQSHEDLSVSGVEHAAHLPKEILQCRAVATEINFSSREQLNNCRLVQSVLFRDQCTEVWNFRFGCVIPHSTNTWQLVMEAHPQIYPAEVLSGKVVIYTVLYDGDLPIASSKVRLYYK